MEMIPNSPAMRVWIVAPRDWRPDSLFDVPGGAIALHPAREECMTASEAEEFVSAFNEQMLAHGAARWAVARRVVMRLENDYRRGEPIDY